MNIFFLSWHEPSSYIKDQLPKIDFKIKGCLEFFYFSKMAKTVFDLKNRKKNIFLSFSYFLAKKKELILFQVKPLKMPNINFCCC